MNYSTFNTRLKESLGNLYPDREIESIGRLVLEYLTGLSWVQIRLNLDRELTPDQAGQASRIIARLIRHEPVQYILGETEFYGLKLMVAPGVLIPRGETEELVEWILEAQGTRHKAQGAGEGRKGSRVLDIGCGSGAIAVSLAKHLVDAEVVAVDISDEALQLTSENAILHNLRISLVKFDILAPQPLVIPAKAGTPSRCTDASAGASPFPSGQFDIIASNPPYVPLSEMTAMDLHVVEYEPKMALFVPDDDPLIFYRAIAEFAALHLNPCGQVFVEIHDRLGNETAALFGSLFSKVEIRRDIHGKERMIRAYHE